MLANYYLAVADHMLPHIADRPLSIVRCPEGAANPASSRNTSAWGFLPASAAFPFPIRRTDLPSNTSPSTLPEGLVGLAQMGVLEIHPWGSKNDSLEKPDRIIFDLDPDESIDWKMLGATAKEFRSRLEDLGLQVFSKPPAAKACTL